MLVSTIVCYLPAQPTQHSILILHYTAKQGRYLTLLFLLLEKRRLRQINKSFAGVHTFLCSSFKVASTSSAAPQRISRGCSQTTIKQVSNHIRTCTFANQLWVVELMDATTCKTPQ